MDEWTVNANVSFLRMVLVDYTFIKIAALVAIAVGLVLLLIALYNERKRGWPSTYFILLCVAVCLWAAFLFLEFTDATGQNTALWNALQVSCAPFVSALVYLHVQKQVSYKRIGSNVIVIILAIPALFTVLMMQSVHVAVASEYFPAILNIASVTMYGFNFVMLIMAYMQCFNVMFQMPRHMRKSTQYLIVGVTALVVYYIVNIVLGNSSVQAQLSEAANLTLRSLGAMIASIVMMSTFFQAFKTSPADNVIVTSREFVLSSLSTVILVLSKAKRILDWNMKSDFRQCILPDPYYKEPYDTYRARLIQSTGARVSQSSPSIITIPKDGAELHYLFTLHDISYRKKLYGYLVEIAEVTNVFDTIRTLEDSAMIDQLTGLYNRNAYMQQVEKIIDESCMPLVVIVGDVNNLKTVNDEWGHLAGDKVLKGVAGIIKTYKPEQAFASRIGGDEFVILLPAGSVLEAALFVEHVDESCKKLPPENYGTPSVSWGWAVMRSTEEEYNNIFAQADSIMYKAKKARFRFRASGMVPTEERNRSVMTVAEENLRAAGHENGEVVPDKGRAPVTMELRRAAEMMLPGNKDDALAPDNEPIPARQEYETTVKADGGEPNGEKSTPMEDEKTTLAQAVEMAEKSENEEVTVDETEEEAEMTQEQAHVGTSRQDDAAQKKHQSVGSRRERHKQSK